MNKKSLEKEIENAKKNSDYFVDFLNRLTPPIDDEDLDEEQESHQESLSK